MARHRPIEVIEDGRRVCSADGLDVIGFGASLRHIGEGVPVVIPEPEDARSVARALEIARAVARRLSGASHEEIAAAVAETLYVEGFLLRRPGRRRGASVHLHDPEPRALDHAERAAGERPPERVTV